MCDHFSRSPAMRIAANCTERSFSALAHSPAFPSRVERGKRDFDGCSHFQMRRNMTASLKRTVIWKYNVDAWNEGNLFITSHYIAQITDLFRQTETLLHSLFHSLAHSTGGNESQVKSKWLECIFSRLLHNMANFLVTVWSVLQSISQTFKAL